MSDMQLEINLNPVSGNRLRQTLESGQFLTLIETQVPDGEMDKASALKRLETLEKQVLAWQDGNTALAIVDNPNRPDWNAIEFAAGLPAANRDCHLVALSGAGKDKDTVLELIQMAENAGLPNLVPVSGTVPERSRSAKECAKINFTESTIIQKMLAKKADKFYTAAAVNPFQYTPWTLLGSYYKLFQKLNSGAGFMITQIGWDMLKLQSLSWYLTGRSMHYPKIARLMLLSPEKVEAIRSGSIPGVKLSRDMKKLLEKELTYSRSQFEHAQYRRLALQIAGCRHLGFSGVQIAGADNPAKIDFILKQVKNALEEFDSFDAWLDEYNAFVACTEMAPCSDSYKMYDHILHRNYPYDNPPDTRELPKPEVSLAEKFACNLKSFLFAHAGKQRAANGRLLKKIFADCRSCEKCTLPQKNFICPQCCPMKLVNGICGAVNSDGNCPFSGQECVHHKILRLAHWRNRLPEQENIVSGD